MATHGCTFGAEMFDFDVILFSSRKVYEISSFLQKILELSFPSLFRQEAFKLWLNPKELHRTSESKIRIFVSDS